MTVFIAHAEADRASAEALEKYLERRGVFAEIEDGARAFRAAQGADLIVALWSKGASGAPHRLALERRTLEAWADDRLVLVKLDRAFAPVGLRDLPAIDASVEVQRDIAWAAVNKRAVEERAPPPVQAVETTQPRSRNVALPVALGVVTAIAFAALTIALFGVRPRWVAELPPAAYQIALPAVGAISAMLLMGLVALAARRAGAAGAGAPGDHVFLSYAPEDGAAATAFVEAVQARGRATWLPSKSDAPTRETVTRAMDAARSVVTLCSARAFDCDRVKRETFLAARGGKNRLAVSLDAAAVPEDFAPLLAGARRLDLHAIPEAERADAIAWVLKPL